MKLAEALVLRGDLAKRLEQVRARALRNARVQEGDAPAEDPSALMSEYDRLADELESLISRINRTKRNPFGRRHIDGPAGPARRAAPASGSLARLG